MDKKALFDKFELNDRIYKKLQEEALFIISEELEKKDIKLHSIQHRIKKFKSFYDKAEIKQLVNPFDEIRDIVGIRIICLFISDIAKIIKILKNSFQVIDEDNKIEGETVTEFGYMSVHLIVTMKKEYIGPRYTEIMNTSFEIQIRTIAMDAWANVSHYLSYKSDRDVPSELKRDFYALSGLFYVADKHFELFYSSSEKSKKNTSNLFKDASVSKISYQEINLDTISEYIKSSFPDRKQSEEKTISLLIDELTFAGYKTIGDIDKAVKKAQTAFLEYEKKEHKTGKFAGVGVMRISLKLADDKYILAHIQRLNPKITEEEKQNALDEELIAFNKYRQLIN